MPEYVDDQAIGRVRRCFDTRKGKGCVCRWLGLPARTFPCDAVAVRHIPFFRTERGIFLYHAVSATLFSIAALGTCVIAFNDVTLAVTLGLVAAHGIYSLSFLELWSLAQGSFSIGIIAGAQSGSSLSRAPLIESFARIGDHKKCNRLATLSKLGLIEHHDGSWMLTSRGVLLGKLLASLLRQSKIRIAG
jgi:hypothetical protein